MEEIIVATAVDPKHVENEKKVLQFVKQQMETIMVPYLKTHYLTAAEKYRKNRDEKNKNFLIPVKNKMYGTLQKLFEKIPYVEVHLMSSIGSNLNLIDESDIDFGLLVAGLNTTGILPNLDILTKIRDILITNGFKFDHIFNISEKSNRYVSFQKYVNGVEIEVKIRDKETTKPMMRLHKRLDNNLSEEQITLYTYAKYILSQQADKKNYKLFKKIMYESVFCEAEGSHMFPMP